MLKQPNPLISVSKLYAGYNKQSILHNISFDLYQGSFLGIVAPNGTGKSTLLKTLAGLISPLHGQIIVNGQPLHTYNRLELAQLIAVASSSCSDYAFTILEVVSMGRFPHISRFAKESSQDLLIIDNALKKVGLWEKRYTLVTEISQGEAQKVSIARALAQESQILLLDEPTSHLDMRNQIEILNLIKNIALTKKVGVIAVLHDINLALHFSTHLLLMKDGYMLSYGKTNTALSLDILKQMYNMDFSLFTDKGHTYVQPCYSC